MHDYNFHICKMWQIGLWQDSDSLCIMNKAVKVKCSYQSWQWVMTPCYAITMAPFSLPIVICWADKTLCWSQNVIHIVLLTQMVGGVGDQEGPPPTSVALPLFRGFHLFSTGNIITMLPYLDGAHWSKGSPLIMIIKFLLQIIKLFCHLKRYKASIDVH